MSAEIKVTAAFEKEFKRLAKKYPSLPWDLGRLIDELENKPTTGTNLGDSLYKIRLAISSKGKGKSGGARVITYVVIKNKTVYLASIYDKAEHSTINIDALLNKLKEAFG